LPQRGEREVSRPRAGHRESRALELLVEARRLAEASDAPALLIPIYELLADLYERRGEASAAVSCLRLLAKTERRLFNEASDRRVKRLELEKARRDAESARHNAEVLRLRNVELARAAEESERLRALADEWARTDALTGVANRRALEEFLAEEGERARRHGRPLALALADVDYFKRVNDTLGHGAGDDVLCRVAEILRANVRRADRVARWGGEEFAVLLPETDAATAVARCEHLRQAILREDWSRVHHSLTGLTVSIGVGVLRTGGASAGEAGVAASPRDLLTVADANLYQAKRAGRNRVAA
jgi:diguanylate cyclase (GGDEF)-like protein